LHLFRKIKSQFVKLQLIITFSAGPTYQPEFYFLDFCHINEKWIGFKNSQIFHIEINLGTMTLTELDSDGLDGNKITSIFEV